MSNFEGNPNDWIVCPSCGSEDAYYVDWRPDNDLTLDCPDCDETQYDGAWWNGNPEDECYYHEI